MNGGKEKSIVVRTALSQIRYRKSQSILIAISIMLTTALIMMIGSCTLGMLRYQEANTKTFYGDYHGIYVRMDSRQYEQIRDNEAFEQVGRMQKVAKIEENDISGLVYEADETIFRMLNFSFEEGGIPTKANEIAAPRSFFQKCGYQGVLGEEVSFRYRVLGKGEYIQQQFIISGITHSSEVQELAGRFPCYVSEQYTNAAIAPEDRQLYIYFKIAQEKNYNMATLQEKIKQVTDAMGIEEKALDINTMYLMFAVSPNMEWIVAGIFIAVLVIFFSSLVIYNIFYVGLVSRIKEFGKIRAMGAARKQLKGMVLLEGILLGGCGVPVGILLGGILSQFGFQALVYEMQNAQKGDIQLLRISTWSPEIIMITAIAAFFTIWVSLRKPMKIAARVSPVEAIRFENQSSHQGKNRLKRYEMNLLRLSAANLFRNKKRTVTTILTMGLSSILFIVVANVGASMSVEDLARRDMEKGDFEICLEYATHDETYPENNLYALQERGLLNDEFVEAVKAIPGITEVEVRKGVAVKLKIGEEDVYRTVSAVSEADWEARGRDVTEGEETYSQIQAGGGLIFTSGFWIEEYDMEVGDEIALVLLNGKEEITVNRELMTVTESYDNATFITPQQNFESMGLQGNTNYQVFVYCDPRMLSEVEKALKELTAAEEAYHLVSYEKMFSDSQLALRITILPAYALLAALGAIGFMNMANTIITGMITRKREIGMLQAIGLTGRQLERMLQMEGLVFTLGTLGLSLTVGNALGYRAFVWARDNHIMGIRHYHFPMVETICFVSILIGLQLILSYVMSRYIRKEAIIDRIRYSE